MNAFHRCANQDRDCGQEPKSRETIFVHENAHWVDIAATHIARTLCSGRGCS
jgi:hypothetical protein